MDVASLTAQALKAEGVKFVFGIPGGPSIPYMEAWRSADIPFILTSHEGAAGIMADVTSRLTSAPGVCHATFGPGATNLSTGVGCALLDRSAVIAFTTEVPDNMLHRTSQMNIDHQKLFAPLTKESFRLTGGDAGKILSSAFKNIRSELPGPVHIGLPSDVSGNHVSEPFITTREVEKLNTVVKGDVARLLSSARRPVMAVGLTAMRLGLTDSIRSFLRRCPMPVVLTPMAKGVVAVSDECYAGVLFHSLSDKVEELAASADLIIGIGYDPVEYNYESWVRPGTPLVHFDTIESDIPGGADCAFVASEPEEWFRLLTGSLPETDFLEGRGVAEVRSEIEAIFSSMGEKWGPVRVMQMLRQSVPDESVLVCDVGSHLHLAGQFWPSERPGEVMMTNGWSTMGFGIPAGNAAALSVPGCDVNVVTGDGGFLMSAGEIMTARRYELPVRVVVISDRELNLIKVKQSWRDIDPYATVLLDGDLFGAEKFLGVDLLHAGSTDSMADALVASHHRSGPVIINAVVNGEDYNRLIVRR